MAIENFCQGVDIFAYIRQINLLSGLGLLLLKGCKMEKVIENKFIELLMKTKEDIISSLLSESKEFEAIVDDMDPKDLADLAADDIDKKTLEALNQKDLRKLRLIDSALSRAKNGRYGLCMRCGVRIPEERLEAIPYALMCIDCRSIEERKSR